MGPMRLTAIAILFTALTIAIAFAIIIIRKKLREFDDEIGLPQRID
jgi:hypothetical protein